MGLNCALGAADMKPYIANLAACADCYVFAYPNAGLPNAMGGYDQKDHEMAEGTLHFLSQWNLHIARVTRRDMFASAGGAIGACC